MIRCAVLIIACVAVQLYHDLFNINDNAVWRWRVDRLMRFWQLADELPCVVIEAPSVESVENHPGNAE